MIGSLCQVGARKIFFALLGATVLLSFTGWQLCSMGGLAVDGASQPNDPAPQPRRQEVAQTPPVKEDPQGAADKVPSIIDEGEPSKLESLRKKDPPKGKEHDRPSELLRFMVNQLHSDAVDHFINTRGMGFARMGPTVRLVQREWKTPWFSQDELAKETPVSRTKDFDLIHRGSIKLFADSNTVPPKKRVTWNTNEKAKKEKLWEIKSLDLVGVVMHDTPVVYMSEKIPAMKDLSTKPTRPLDYFELAGLEQLLKGEAIYVRSKDDTLRVLGPIQAGKACLKCHHESKEGDLLGAFSYTIRAGQYRMVDFKGRPWMPDGGIPRIPGKGPESGSAPPAPNAMPNPMTPTDSPKK
jgi:hypothetical protein